MSVAAGARLFRRVGWNVVDQALSALSNVVLSVLVARSVSAAGFGTFSTAFVIFGIAVAVTRSGVGQPLQIGFSAAAPDVRHQATRRALGCALLIGLSAAALVGGAGLLLGGELGPALLALAVVLPGLLLQDSCRMAMFTAGRPAAAALIDGVWAVAQVCLLLACTGLGWTSVPILIVAWGFSATLSAVLGLVVLRLVPAPRRGLAWLRDERKLTKYLLGEYVFGLGSAQLAILLVGVLASTTAVGALRAAQVLLGPLGIVGAAAFQFSVPEVARRPELSRSRRLLFAGGVSGALGLITVVYLAVLLLLPDPVGVALFGDSWSGAAAVLLAMGVSSLASSLANGPAGVLYGMGRAQATFRINLAKGPLLLCVVSLATVEWGVVGAAWALAAVEAAVLPAWWLTLTTATRQAKLDPASVDPAQPVAT
jgi:O-antigen/teichoic acid export membrane protein